ncbi:MAG: 50S ribosomal protein L15 [Pseudomonadota bacterium]|jgi:large subunit ribosomal protein L15|nr:50S ribosomal protein L15 [Pseudomonadota bacterium]MED5462450.1 50S ribosomal protein L15 [Pseudomonadota bacterium]MEE3236841.1 50S ribosomal protein L15 [Pseudomonadota bacterium]
MRLNELSPGKGAKKTGKRFGRGHSAGQGKTCGRGQKGQHARSGGYHKVGFEGGQMPLQRRLPKVGFRSRMAKYTAELRLHELVIPKDDVIDLDCLKKLNLVPAHVTKVKVIKSGELQKAVKLKGIAVTKGARAAIEAVGGSIE